MGPPLMITSRGVERALSRTALPTQIILQDISVFCHSLLACPLVCSELFVTKMIVCAYHPVSFLMLVTIRMFPTIAAHFRIIIYQDLIRSFCPLLCLRLSQQHLRASLLHLSLYNQPFSIFTLLGKASLHFHYVARFCLFVVVLWIMVWAVRPLTKFSFTCNTC